MNPVRKVLFAVVVAVSLVSRAAEPVRVLIWDEQQPEQKKAYGDSFLGETIAGHLKSLPGIMVKSVSLASAEQGLDAASLDATDVLIWWSHTRNHVVEDARAEAVVTRVLEGKLSLVALHSAHWAKPFVRLMQERAKADALAKMPEGERAGVKFVNDQPYRKMVKAGAPLTPSVAKSNGTWVLTLPQCVFPSWRADGAPSHVTTLLPEHPLAKGIPAKWDVLQTEMYCEPFHVPAPDAVVFEERWDKGEHFRSGCVWTVGKGRVFYFRPGHETYPVFKQAESLRVLENAVRWLAPAR